MYLVGNVNSKSATSPPWPYTECPFVIKGSGDHNHHIYTHSPKLFYVLVTKLDLKCFYTFMLPIQTYDVNIMQSSVSTETEEPAQQVSMRHLT